MGGDLRLSRAIRMLAFCVAALLFSVPSEGCSCARPDSGFLASSGIALPKSARGLPWWGSLGFCDDEVSCREELEDVYSRVAVEILNDGRFIPLSFELEILPRELPESAYSYSSSWLVLVVPSRLEPGDELRFVYRAGAPRLVPYTGESNEAAREQEVLVTVSTEDIPKQGSMRVEVESQRPISLEILDPGSCSEKITVQQSMIHLEGEPFDTWKDVLLISTYVNGHLWRPQHSFCLDVPQGLSWMGRGHERVFIECSNGGEGTSKGKLEEGAQLIRMVAWVPGTNIRFEALGEADLQCHHPSVSESRTAHRRCPLEGNRRRDL